MQQQHNYSKFADNACESDNDHVQMTGLCIYKLKYIWFRRFQLISVFLNDSFKMKVCTHPLLNLMQTNAVALLLTLETFETAMNQKEKREAIVDLQSTV